MENTIIMNNVDTKVKKVSLNGQGFKYMAFGNWLIERQVTSGLMTSESVVESRKLLAMFSSVEEQVEFYAKFANECKEHSKNVKAAIRQHNKPPPKAKAVKVVGDAEKKRGRKKKEVVAGAEDPVQTLNEQLVAAAQSDEPIAPPEFVRGPKESEIPQVVENNTKNDVSSFVNAMEAKVDEAKAAKAAKAAKPFEDELKKAAKAAEAEAKKAAKAAEAEAKKAAKEAEAEAKKAAKEAEAEAKKAAKAAEAEAKKATKAEAKKATKTNIAAPPIPVLERATVGDNGNDSLDEEELDEEELEMEVFTHEGIEYLMDEEKNVYNRNTLNLTTIGKYDEESKTIKMNKNGSELVMGM
jgi:hypothetical protein